MAFASVICGGASSSLIRRATRAFWAARNFRTAVSNVPAVENQSLTHEIARGGSFLPLSSRLIHTSDEAAAYAAAVAADDAADLAPAADDATIKRADEDFVTLIEREFKLFKCRTVDPIWIPIWFPFEIEKDVAGQRAVFFTRKYENETIKVECRDIRLHAEDPASMPIYKVKEADTKDDDNNKEDKEEADTKDYADPASMPMLVTISKEGTDHQLEFRITAFTSRINIDSVSLKNLAWSQQELPYEGPHIFDMGMVRSGFYKYLDVRGINVRTAEYLLEYFGRRDDEEYETWLNNLKQFVALRSNNSQVTTTSGGDRKIWLNNLNKFFSGGYKICLKNLHKFVA